jgi:hypothetical protein
VEDQTYLSPETEDLIGLGIVLGQNQTLGILAARCSAAQAENLRRLRTEKIYKRVCEDWREFCPKYLNMSGPQADKIVRLFEEFGPGYFDLAQLTRISPETYRAISPAVSNGVLELNGEQIEITIENSRKVAAAVSVFRRAKSAKPTAELSVADRVERINRLYNEICRELMDVPHDSAEVFQDCIAAMYPLTGALGSLREQYCQDPPQ